MPATYTLIASNTLSSSAASVTFSAIPGTYTDLVIRATARGNRSNPEDQLYIQFNTSTANFSGTYLDGSGSTATSGRWANFVAHIPAATATSNTFGSTELYIPNYAGSTNKPFSSFTVAENNTSAAYMAVVAGLRSNTASVTSITIEALYGNLMVSGSSFFLYGIKNS